MTVVFRCDASPTLGLGHLSRCLALADELLAIDARSIFVMSGRAPDIAALPVRRGHAARVMGEEAAHELGEEDAAAVLESCADAGAKWIVVDHYGATPAYLGRLDGSLHRLCVIDDLGDRDVGPASLVVSPSPGMSAEQYHSNARCTFLLGPKFAMLASSFRRKRTASLKRRRTVSHPERVLVSLGGGDVAATLTATVLSTLREALPRSRVDLVVGPAAARALNVDDDRVVLHTALPPDRFADVMAHSDLAIATPSTVSWELSCLGVPAVLIPTADNQRRVASFMADTIGNVARSADELPVVLKTVLERLGSSPEAVVGEWAAVCDGNGASRVAAAIHGAVQVRRATSDDKRWFWEINNHPAVRGRSIHTRNIDWAEHCEWFDSALANPSRVLYVGETAGDRVGVLRLDVEPEESAAYVSVAIDPTMHGRGLGRQLIEAGSELAASLEGVDRLIALIRPDNEASRRSFSAAGYRQASSTSLNGVELLQYAKPVRH